MSTQTFLLPDVGEGLTEAEIVSWRVSPGDTVAVNDVLVEIETAKSLVELPSPFEGVVGDLLAGEGDTVDVGAAIITIAVPRTPRPRPTPAERARRADEPRPVVPCSSDTAPAVTCSRAGASRPQRRGRGIRRRRREAADPQARPRPRCRPRRTWRPAAPPGEVTREDVLKHASQASVFRNIETPEWGEVREETIPGHRRRPSLRPRPAASSAVPEPRRSGARSRSPCAACARRRPAP